MFKTCLKITVPITFLCALMAKVISKSTFFYNVLKKYFLVYLKVAAHLETMLNKFTDLAVFAVQQYNCQYWYTELQKFVLTMIKKG